MAIVPKEHRHDLLTSGHGRWATRTEVTVGCVEERGAFYASMNTLNASASESCGTMLRPSDPWGFA